MLNLLLAAHLKASDNEQLEAVANLLNDEHLQLPLPYISETKTASGTKQVMDDQIFIDGNEGNMIEIEI